jgi:hypothetical protein
MITLQSKWLDIKIPDIIIIRGFSFLTTVQRIVKSLSDQIIIIAFRLYIL